MKMKTCKCLLVIFTLTTGKILCGQKYLYPVVIEQQVDQYLALYEKHDLFNGTVLIAQKGEILLNKGYGYADYKHRVKNRQDTRFRIASISKIFTKLCIIQLVEKNHLSFDDKLSKFIPDYSNGDQITVRHLFNHTSGIPNINDFGGYDQLAKECYAVEEVIALFKNKPLDFKPGTQKKYSNSGYTLLAYLIEKASGLDYGKYLQQYIFDPAEMKDSGHDTGTQIIPNLADGYMMNLQGPGLQKPLYYNPSIKIGSGSLYATTVDLFRFSQAYQSGKLSKTTQPLYIENTFGKSPGYTAVIWNAEDIFIVILSNNYNTPVSRIGSDLVNMMLGDKYAPLQIKGYTDMKTDDLDNYTGNFKIGNNVITVEKNGNVLIEYINGDKWRGGRLIPTGKDTFFDVLYFEEITFNRNETGRIIGFTWKSGDTAFFTF